LSRGYESDQAGFAVLPRRGVVERFFAWLNRNRSLAKVFVATVASATAFRYAASVMLLARRQAGWLVRDEIRVELLTNRIFTHLGGRLIGGETGRSPGPLA
jgi:hypothetical protein